MGVHLHRGMPFKVICQFYMRQQLLKNAGLRVRCLEMIGIILVQTKKQEKVPMKLQTSQTASCTSLPWTQICKNDASKLWQAYPRFWCHIWWLRKCCIFPTENIESSIIEDGHCTTQAKKAPLHSSTARQTIQLPVFPVPLHLQWEITPLQPHEIQLV